MSPTLRYSLIYGGLSATVLGAFIAMLGLYHDSTGWVASLAFGYSVMLVAMSFIFVGVKRFRDVERGGVIGFWRAFGLGLLIALIAGTAYALIWEVYLALTGNVFMDKFIAKTLAEYRAAGMSAAKLAAKAAEFNDMRVMYANPLIRIPLTFSEVAPVGLLVAIISAALLRFYQFLPIQANAERLEQLRKDRAEAAQAEPAPDRA